MGHLACVRKILTGRPGVAKARALHGQTNRHVVAAVGAGALTGGMCWEALNNIGACDRRRSWCQRQPGPTFPRSPRSTVWISDLRQRQSRRNAPRTSLTYAETRKLVQNP
ncbi:1-deoxy-D-xylulose-5-phosphate synthase N-terminal domain-containing protein [Lentzea atacamensis]|uniref:1-deoxy-D-xylulose-5-phosphate synthase N-terminal domain-containing protein n=1 Tax=Lentzea atacamensis TaxID=531938 RepID=UPI001F20E62A|nr:1-deoxy-D-xylulose-5-phosphate synthase N-terminal domain-containing protein [Lentzea atacamensis]